LTLHVAHSLNERKPLIEFKLLVQPCSAARPALFIQGVVEAAIDTPLGFRIGEHLGNHTDLCRDNAQEFKFFGK